MNNLQALYNADGGIHYIKYNQVFSAVDRVYTDCGYNNANTDTILVFLGIDESEGQGSEGQAYWALDLTPKGVHQAEYTQLIAGKKKKLNFVEYILTEE